MTDDAELTVTCDDGHELAIVGVLWRWPEGWLGGREALDRVARAAYCDALAAGELVVPDRIKLTCPDCGRDATRRMDRLADGLDRLVVAGMTTVRLAALAN